MSGRSSGTVARPDSSVCTAGANRARGEKSVRSTGPFVPINCAAIPGELLETGSMEGISLALANADLQKNHRIALPLDSWRL